MPDKIVIEGIPPYDGEYEFEFGQFTNRELHRIKVATKLRAMDFEDAFMSRDPDLFLGLALVVLERQGKTVLDDVLWDAEVGKIRLVLGEDEPSPPEESQESERPDDKKPSSGDDSEPVSESPESGPNPTGAPV